MWRQMLTQAEQFDFFVQIVMASGWAGGGMANWDASQQRSSESLNGWLRLRVTEISGGTADAPGAQPLWTERFCAISNNLFLVYSDEASGTPEELICLQFATVSAIRDVSHAFLIKTPLRSIELRTDDDTLLTKWTDAIFSLQCSESFSKLVPQGLRKQHLLGRLRGKSGEVAVRLLRRANPRSRNAQSEYEPMLGGAADTATNDPVGEGLELSVMLKDPKLGGLLRSFAQDHGAAADLQLYANVNEMMGGADVETLDAQQVELLPQSDKRNLLRLSKNLLQPGASDEAGASRPGSARPGDSSLMQEAYEQASRRLIGELLPRFCETDGFKGWLAQQQEDERAEMELVAVMQSPTGFPALRDFVRGRPEEQLLIATARVEELLTISNANTPHLKLAQQLLEEHFSFSPTAVKFFDKSSKEALAAAVGLWGGSESDEGLRTEALVAFQHVLVADLRPGLLAEFAKFKASPGYGRVLDEMLGREASNKTNLVHWMHLPVGFDVMREWMAQMRAAENLDFIGDVIKFKNLDDVAYTKENAARIHSKFIAEGSVAQICISVDTFNQIHEGLSMRYPSHSLFDDAAEHITSFMQQDLWESFKTSTAYQMASSGVHSSLSLNSNPPLLLSIRWIASPIRHVICLSKRIVTIGSANCDVVTVEAGTKHTSVLRVELAPTGGASFVSMLWNAAPRANNPTKSHLSDSRSSTTSSVLFERHRTAVIAQQAPRLVKHGETFLLGDFEAMLLPINK